MVTRPESHGQPITSAASNSSTSARRVSSLKLRAPSRKWACRRDGGTIARSAFPEGMRSLAPATGRDAGVFPLLHPCSPITLELGKARARAPSPVAPSPAWGTAAARGSHGPPASVAFFVAPRLPPNRYARIATDVVCVRAKEATTRLRMEDRTAPIAAAATYSSTARRFHWWTAALVAIQAPVGFAMVYRGGTLNIWDGITNALFNSHKLIGIVIFFLVLARLTYRLTRGAPADEPSIERWQKAASHATHWSLYLLLLLVPIGGYLGISLYGALDVYGLPLPAIASANKAAAERVFFLHWIGAVLIILLVGAHVSAALFHYFIRKDGVLQRMWVRAGRRA